MSDNRSNLRKSTSSTSSSSISTSKPRPEIIILDLDDDDDDDEILQGHEVSTLTARRPTQRTFTPSSASSNNNNHNNNSSSKLKSKKHGKDSDKDRKTKDRNKKDKEKKKTTKSTTTTPSSLSSSSSTLSSSKSRDEVESPPSSPKSMSISPSLSSSDLTEQQPIPLSPLNNIDYPDKDPVPSSSSLHKKKSLIIPSPDEDSMKSSSSSITLLHTGHNNILVPKQTPLSSQSTSTSQSSNININNNNNNSSNTNNNNNNNSSSNIPNSPTSTHFIVEEDINMVNEYHKEEEKQQQQQEQDLSHIESMVDHTQNDNNNNNNNNNNTKDKIIEDTTLDNSNTNINNHNNNSSNSGNSGSSSGGSSGGGTPTSTISTTPTVSSLQRTLLQQQQQQLISHKPKPIDPKVHQLLEELGILEYEDTLANECMTWDILKICKEEHLKQLGIPLGHALLIKSKVNEPPPKISPPTPPPPVPPAPPQPTPDILMQMFQTIMQSSIQPNQVNLFSSFQQMFSQHQQQQQQQTSVQTPTQTPPIQPQNQPTPTQQPQPTQSVQNQAEISPLIPPILEQLSKSHLSDTYEPISHDDLFSGGIDSFEHQQQQQQQQQQEQENERLEKERQEKEKKEQEEKERLEMERLEKEKKLEDEERMAREKREEEERAGKERDRQAQERAARETAERISREKLLQDNRNSREREWDRGGAGDSKRSRDRVEYYNEANRDYRNMNQRDDRNFRDSRERDDRFYSNYNRDADLRRSSQSPSFQPQQSANAPTVSPYFASVQLQPPPNHRGSKDRDGDEIMRDNPPQQRQQPTSFNSSRVSPARITEDDIMNEEYRKRIDGMKGPVNVADALGSQPTFKSASTPPSSNSTTSTSTTSTTSTSSSKSDVSGVELEGIIEFVSEKRQEWLDKNIGRLKRESISKYHKMHKSLPSYRTELANMNARTMRALSSLVQDDTSKFKKDGWKLVEHQFQDYWELEWHFAHASRDTPPSFDENEFDSKSPSKKQQHQQKKRAVILEDEDSLSENENWDDDAILNKSTTSTTSTTNSSSPTNVKDRFNLNETLYNPSKQSKQSLPKKRTKPDNKGNGNKASPIKELESEEDDDEEDTDDEEEETFVHKKHKSTDIEDQYTSLSATDNTSPEMDIDELFPKPQPPGVVKKPATGKRYESDYSDDSSSEYTSSDSEFESSVFEVDSSDKSDDSSSVLNSESETTYDETSDEEPTHPSDKLPPKPSKLVSKESSKVKPISPKNSSNFIPSTRRSYAKKVEDVNEDTLRIRRKEEEEALKIQKLRKEREDSYSRDKSLVYAGKTQQDDILIHRQISTLLKPHQLLGVRFMWENIIVKEKGCILAHSMGLGKTLQVITFIHTHIQYYSKTKSKYLLIVPANTIYNWKNEFSKWLPQDANDIKVSVYMPRSTEAKKSEVTKDINRWSANGGVMLLTYEYFMHFYSDLETKTKEPSSRETLDFQQLIKCDMVFIDEGHKIKSQATKSYISISKIKTDKRVILTGYPLQNNLKEYYTMINFVRENFLGTNTEFRDRFIRPVEIGSKKEATKFEYDEMRKRLFALSSLTKDFIYRLGPQVLEQELPKKIETIISVKGTEIQYKLLDILSKLGKRIIESQELGSLICNHPDTLLERKPLSVKDINKKSVPELRELLKQHNLPSRDCTEKDELVQRVLYVNERCFLAVDSPFVTELDSTVYRKGVIEHSTKMVILFQLLEQCVSLNERVVVFSSSIATLNLIEYFLQLREGFKWKQSIDYYRLDGTTRPQDRQIMIHKYNDLTNSIKLFLISTKAGSLGTNLTGGTRVILFDLMWNPVHERQAVFRCFRIGQTKPVYVYTIITAASLEENMYPRLIQKQQLAKRTIDRETPKRSANAVPTNIMDTTTNTLTQDKAGIQDLISKSDDPVLKNTINSSMGDIVKLYDFTSFFEEDAVGHLTKEEEEAALHKVRSEMENKTAPPNSRQQERGRSFSFYEPPSLTKTTPLY